MDFSFIAHAKKKVKQKYMENTKNTFLIYENNFSSQYLQKSAKWSLSGHALVVITNKICLTTVKAHLKKYCIQHN